VGDPSGKSSDPVNITDVHNVRVVAYSSWTELHHVLLGRGPPTFNNWVITF